MRTLWKGGIPGETLLVHKLLGVLARKEVAALPVHLRICKFATRLVTIDARLVTNRSNGQEFWQDRIRFNHRDLAPLAPTQTLHTVV